MAADRKCNQSPQNRGDGRCDKSDLQRVAKSRADIWRTAWVHPVAQCETSPDKVALARIIERERDRVENWNEKIGETNNCIYADEVSSKPS